MKAFLAIVMLAISSLCFSGDEILLRMTCSPEVDVFEITATSVDFNYKKLPNEKERYELLSGRYGLYQWPEIGKEIKCDMGKDTFSVKRYLDSSKSKYSLTMNNSSLIENFIFTDNVTFSGSLVRSVKVRGLGSSAYTEVCFYLPKSHMVNSFLNCRSFYFSTNGNEKLKLPLDASKLVEKAREELVQ